MKNLKRLVKIIFMLAAFIGVFSLIMGCNTINQDKENTYKIIKVIDGDTYVLNNGEKVRLIGVNTPEIHHPTKGVEYFGKEAAEFAKSLLLNQKVNLNYDVGKRDQYGRLLAYVYLQDGTFVNAKLIKEGYARIMTVPPNVEYVDYFSKLEKEARENNRGLWAKKTGLNNKPSDMVSGENIIKGNINSRGQKIYHLPGGRYYQQTKAERIFYSEDEAIKAGFRKSKE